MQERANVTLLGEEGEVKRANYGTLYGYTRKGVSARTVGTMSEHTVDVIVIGAGPVGENVAHYAQQGGLTALLVEKELVGGECSYYACMPSKALLRPLDIAGVTRNLSGITESEVRREELLARRDEWVNNYDDSSQMEWADSVGVDVVRGHARITGERSVEVVSDGSSRTVEARRAVVIAAGSTPNVPELYRGLHAWGSRDATGVIEVPERLLIVGGGVVACEAATWMRALGSEVTMLLRGESLLSGREPFAGELVRDSLEARGVRVLTGVDVDDARRDDARDTGLGRIHGGTVHLTAGEEVYEADELLLATGRRPALADVGLDTVGRSADDVAERNLPEWLFVVGDAGPGASLTHQGKYEARSLGARLAGSPETSAPGPVPTPQVVFTEPQVAAVGMTEEQALQEGLKVLSSEVDLGAVAGVALLRDDATGRAKLVVDADSGVLLGATFVGPEAAELLHAATVAIVGKLPVHVLRHAVPAYPTASEVWVNLLEQFPGRLR